MMPFWLVLTLGRTFFEGNLEFRFVELIFPLGLLVVPAFFGMIFIHYYKDLVTKIKALLKILSWILTIFITASVLFIYRESFHYFSLKLFLVCCIHPYAGYICSYCVAWILKRDHYDRVTIAIETGTQNIGIAVILMMDTFMNKDDPKVFIACTIPMALMLTVDKPLWIIWMVKTLWKKYFKKEKKQIKSEIINKQIKAPLESNKQSLSIDVQ